MKSASTPRLELVHAVSAAAQPAGLVDDEVAEVVWARLSEAVDANPDTQGVLPRDANSGGPGSWGSHGTQSRTQLASCRTLLRAPYGSSPDRDSAR